MALFEIDGRIKVTNSEVTVFHESRYFDIVSINNIASCGYAKGYSNILSWSAILLLLLATYLFWDFMNTQAYLSAFPASPYQDTSQFTLSILLFFASVFLGAVWFFTRHSYVLIETVGGRKIKVKLPGSDWKAYVNVINAIRDASQNSGGQIA